MTTHPAHPTNILSLLVGHWHLDRDIPHQATVQGHATVHLLASGIALYEERVTVQTTTGAHLTATAQYLFSTCPDSALDVHLPRTGALFHTLHFAPTTLGHLEARATHLCAADTYTSTYRLLSPGHLTIEHHVAGPRKLYIARTTLTRIPDHQTPEAAT